MASASEPKVIVETKVVEDDTLSMEAASTGNESTVSKTASEEWAESEDKLIPVLYHTAPRS